MGLIAHWDNNVHKTHTCQSHPIINVAVVDVVVAIADVVITVNIGINSRQVINKVIMAVVCEN